MKSLTTKEKIEAGGIIAIFRRLYGEELYQTCDALYRGGIRVMEVTFDQADGTCLAKTAQAIDTLRRCHGDLIVGAGTVLNEEQLTAAHAAGATYMVAPNVDAELIAKAKELGMAAMPGAMTPTEVAAAYAAGADLVKLFPAGYLGVDYVRHLHAPLGHIPLVATAGITKDNLGAFLQAGCVAAGISGPLSDRKCIADRDYETLTQRAAELMRICKENK